MTVWDFRHLIESAIPLWVVAGIWIVVIAGCLGLHFYSTRRYRK